MLAPKFETVSDHVDWACQRLQNSNVYFGHGCTNARDEAIWATLHVAGFMDYDLEVVKSKTLSAQISSQIQELIQTRIETRKPLAYLIQQAWFAGLAFYIDERAIVPRSHIGDLIQDGLEPWVQPNDIHFALDLCTGSGCIAIALALKHSNLVIDGSDIDTNALEVAQINIDRYELNHRVTVIQSDIFENLSESRYDLIVCNPPYVDEFDINSLPKEYQHEPRHALVSDDSGVGIVRKILCQSRQYLTEQGVLLMELGNSVSQLELAFPNIPFFWLTSRSGESVVLVITANELHEYETIFAK